jgi:ABC-type bacteriocin/lantibiotic exporter with double-glycine peptidase domain
MDYFLKKLANIQKDKLLHFFWGAILSFILMLSFGIFGMFIALIIPAIKELYYDKYLGKGHCDWADYFYSIAPTIMLAIFKYY